MKTRNPRVLVVDDDKYLLEVFKISLEVLDFEIDAISDSEKALSLVSEKDYDLIFLDLKMQPIDGMQILEEVKRQKPNTTVIIISGNSGLDDALKAVDLGAYHILQKPVQIKELQFFAKKAWEYHAIKSELRELKEAAFSNKRENFITQNATMIKSIETALSFADSGMNLLIHGESGTGKKLLAELVHQKSPRAKKPFIVVNCNVPENLLEQELFGVREGAGSASGALTGKLEEALGGTLVLDEIGELSHSIQARLLSVIQSNESKKDIRFISTTTVNIEETLKERLFREDLFYLLNGASIRIIPLRERPEDIEFLFSHFVAGFQKNKPMRMSGDAFHLLKLYRWPGNVLEFKNIIHRAALLTKNDVIEPIHLPDEIQFRNRKDDMDLISLEEVELIHIKKILNRTTDYKVAAKILGIDAATLWRKRKKYKI
ncbi:MAG TPA: sigma-54 dependent transcriptional regulator [Leptospiraceae bacterium]|nr:sigma-54 dependent transcriptional regulator [Leptospiraceae bacterium]HMX34816.1 sigma-54 dependent transcriptional regulator [Leptospiraceae bacterium]HMZ65999.1 sigma-54 dependent transcriptional regulator [Leptospiraceae bacterium]HNA05825.1 sigma-54 dependent transcriptional regulator [Leptospiraceae bacterium]HNC00402.1 sigma-54 dependent transcriptional regulator [Leptospiraceae bacterium]